MADVENKALECEITEINAVVNNLDQYIQSNFSHIYKATILIYKRGSMGGHWERSKPTGPG